MIKAPDIDGSLDIGVRSSEAEREEALVRKTAQKCERIVVLAEAADDKMAANSWTSSSTPWPSWRDIIQVGEIARTADDGDNLQEFFAANPVDDAVAFEDYLADVILVTRLPHHATAAGHEG